MRHRLRFQLRELDLPPGEALIGRGADCLITLDDSLVSRRHARLRIEGSEAIFEDLGSRNGSRINGQAVREPVSLKEGDRVRIGALELVYCRVPAVMRRTTTPTGHLRQCLQCLATYPEELIACPSCGAAERASVDDVSCGGASHP